MLSHIFVFSMGLFSLILGRHVVLRLWPNGRHVASTKHLGEGVTPPPSFELQGRRRERGGVRALSQHRRSSGVPHIQPRPLQIFKIYTSNENLSNICRNFIESDLNPRPTTIQRTSIEHLSTIYRRSIENRSFILPLRIQAILTLV